MNSPALPHKTVELVEAVGLGERHPGLQLDKLSPAGEQKTQGKLIEAVAQCTGDRGLLSELLSRRESMLKDLDALRCRGRTVGPMTLHLARSGALENAGIALHPVYGFAWLPGTGIKGMTRAWTETVWAPGESDPEEAWRLIDATFGTSPGSERKKSWRSSEPTGTAAAGRIVFHDAWPISWPRLERDIVNNHHTAYYHGEGDPGDWENPVPVNFLAVASGAEFEFAVSDRSPGGDDLADLAMNWLRAALWHAGAGAKTAAGYGRIAPVEGERPPASERTVRSEHSLELVSPAFLAGAGQQKADCDLRPATLRGLLRWWWRTMHAAHLARDDLAKLEALVWGDTETGSTVSLALEPGKDNGDPIQYDKGLIQTKHNLERAKTPKVTQGLYYVSYGMDEKNRGQRQQRWFRESGESWKLVLAARAGFWKKERIPAQRMMEQAEAALWLLTRYGAVGSKSRKGFGAFADIRLQSVGSLEDCVATGSRLREICGLRSGQSTGTSALEQKIEPIEVKTPWEDPWFALDRVGHVYQTAVKRRRGEERVVFGLPRNVGRPSRPLGALERHSSPMHWSLGRSSDGSLTIRLIAFLSPKLPDRETSRTVLGETVRHAEKAIKEEAARLRTSGKNPPSPPRPPGNGLPEKRTRVRAVLLSDKTRNEHWRAQQVDGPMVGEIFNHDEVPGDLEAGQEVELYVSVPDRRNGRFLWPSPKVEEQIAGGPRKRPPRGSGNRRRGR